MKTMLFAAALASTLLAGCGGLSSYVAADDAALGRVVVYRNGIAYFERKAHVEGNQLVFKVPHDKVDDFLKSLTVTDSRTQKPLPVSFPTRAANTNGTVEMVVQLPAGTSPDVILSYITEAPAWKPSYRLVVQDDGRVEVQGWAIVDNTSGEDWRSVRLGVGSSSALSFRYDLRSVRLVHRETLSRKARFAVAPPRGGSVIAGNTASGGDKVLSELKDAEIPRPADHPDMQVAQAPPRPEPAMEVSADRSRRASKRSARVRRHSGKAGRRGGAKISRKSKGRYWGKKAPKPATILTKSAPASRPMAGLGTTARPAYKTNTNQVARLARQLKRNDGVVVIEGYANKGEREKRRRALDRAHNLRNALIEKGIAPARLVVRGKGFVPGRAAGVRLVQSQTTPRGGKAGKTEGDGSPIGESHFESKTPLTVERGTSAMVSILDGNAKGTVVYLYDAEAKRGNQRYAFKAVRFVNPTDSTLESGPVTVYGKKRFIGEGLADPIPPHQVAFIPFALDRQIVVDRKGSTTDRISKLVSVVRGVVTAEVQHTRITKLKITNRQPLPATVYVRHTVRKGWELTKAPKVDEKLGDAHLFAVQMTAHSTRELLIEEATPITKTIDMRSDLGLGMVRLYLRTPREDKRLEGPMRALLKVHAEMATLKQRIQSVRERARDYRERLDELQIQVVNLGRLKGGGKLMRHLKNKMVEISERLQKSTIRVVDLQEKLLLAKIRFQDGLSELSLKKVAAAK